MKQNHPLILIPGFTGTQLKTRLGEDLDFRTWINPKAIQRTPPVKGNNNYIAGKRWLDQMILDSDGMTPKNFPLYNTHVSGLDAISTLDPAQSSSQYFFSLIQALKGIGYTDNNLKAAAFDWRLPPSGLELRYQYFTNLKFTIEQLVKQSGLRVVLLGHSLGNRIVQYFLQWVLNNHSRGCRQWIDDHVGRYIAVSALWLGVPKSVHEAVADLGHLGIMNISGVKPLYQSYGALPWMLPVTKEQYKYLNTEFFAFIKDDNHPLSISEVWAMASADGPLRFREKYYQQDHNFTERGSELGNLAIQLPYVESLNIFHASGQNTEIGAYYKRTAHKTLVVNTKAISNNSNFEVIDGVRYEVQGKTKQFIDGSLNSGDGFLPYGSLMYYQTWKKAYPNRKITGQNFSGNTHYNILQNPAFTQEVCRLVSGR